MMCLKIRENPICNHFQKYFFRCTLHVPLMIKSRTHFSSLPHQELDLSYNELLDAPKTAESAKLEITDACE